MLTHIHPKLPMRDKVATRQFYAKMGFRDVSAEDYDGYLILEKDAIELHFFAHKSLDINENDGQVYIRTDDIEGLYQMFMDNLVPIHPAAPLQVKPWGQKEFSVLDTDNNLLIFGQEI